MRGVILTNRRLWTPGGTYPPSLRITWDVEANRGALLGDEVERRERKRTIKASQTPLPERSEARGTSHYASQTPINASVASRRSLVSIANSLRIGVERSGTEKILFLSIGTESYG